MPHKDSNVRLPAELGSRFCVLQEQFSDKPAEAMSQKQAQSGCWLRPHVSGLMVASWHENEKAASQTASQMRICLLLDTVLHRISHSIGIFSKVSGFQKKETTRNNLQT
jgi:hypothetical protein